MTAAGPRRGPRVRAVWGGRPATAQQVAASLSALVAELAPLDPVLTDWRSDAESPFPDGVEEATRWVQRHAARAEPDQGWNVVLVSGGSGDAGVAVTVTEGDVRGHPLDLNEVVVGPVPTWDSSALFARHGRQVLEALVRLWRPDVATLTAPALRDAQERGRRRPEVGALTWFAAHLGEVPPVLPEGARTCPALGGTLVDLLGPEGEFPEPGRVTEVAAWLARVGLRDPLPQVQHLPVG